MTNNYLKINRKLHAYKRVIERLLLSEQAEKAAALLPRYKMLQAAEKELFNEIKK